MNALKSDGHVFGYTKRAPEIQVSLDGDLNAFGWYTHRRRHHLTGDLGASCQSPEQEIAGTGAGTGASDSLVGLGLVDGASEIDRACHRNIRLPAFRPQGDARGIWVIAVLLFQRLLKRSNIHCDLVLYILGHFALTGTASAKPS
jgi:hypothetical protein